MAFSMLPVSPRMGLLVALVLALAAGLIGARAATRPGTARPRFSSPLSIWDGISAAFGEYRGSRVHMGVDFKTRGRTGYPVAAAADGDIVRLKVEYRGYGRAVYIRHDGGFETVYGHLDRFENKALHLEDRVRAKARSSGERYPGDVFLDPPVRVAAGQIIAWSGESGAGPAHLHFELREGDRALNPLTHGLDLPPDTTPPVVRWITLMPAGPGATVNGLDAARKIPLAEVSETDYRAREVPVVSGPFRVSADVYDRYGADNWTTVFRLELSIDGRSVFEGSLDGVSYGGPRFGGLLYDASATHLGPSWFAWFAVPLPSNPLARPESRWSFELPAGRHQGRLRALDAAGNVADVAFDLLAMNPEPRPAPPDQDRPESAAADGLRVAADVPPGERLTPQHDAEERPIPAGLRLLAGPVRVGPDHVPVKGTCRLEWTVPAGAPPPARVGIFSWDTATSTWGSEGAAVEGGGTKATAEVPGPGVFLLAADFAAPVIAGSFPGAGSVLPAGPFTPEAEVSDVGLGIGRDGVRLVLDGKEIPCELDPDRNLARAIEPVSVSAGRHTMRVEVRDRAGNASALPDFAFRMLDAAAAR